MGHFSQMVSSHRANVIQLQAAKAKNRGPGRPTLSNKELLDKALDLFLEYGFERTSIDSITAAAGMAKRTVYLRYKDKMALFKAALQQAIEDWIVPLELLRSAESEDFEKTLIKIGHILVANIMTPAGLRLLRITNAESNRMPEIGAYTYEHGTERTIAYLADLFGRRLPNIVRREVAREAAIAYLYLVVCGPPTMTVWGINLDAEAIERHTEFCVRLFLRGLMPRDNGAGDRQGPLAGSSGLSDIARLEGENRQLRKLLVEAMLEAARLREAPR
jgi:AcrR family transcriptional regulator